MKNQTLGNFFRSFKFLTKKNKAHVLKEYLFPYVKDPILISIKIYFLN